MKIGVVSFHYVSKLLLVYVGCRAYNMLTQNKIFGANVVKIGMDLTPRTCTTDI